jgi:hypothetical protein
MHAHDQMHADFDVRFTRLASSIKKNCRAREEDPAAATAQAVAAAAGRLRSAVMCFGHTRWCGTLSSAKVQITPPLRRSRSPLEVRLEVREYRSQPPAATGT